MRGVVRYLARRIVSALVTLFILSLVAFAMVKVIPGDEAHVAAGATATPAQVEAMRVHLGLDRPWPVQYLAFVGDALHGDLGTSIATHTSIAQGIAQVLPGTLQLTLVALIIMVLVAVPTAVVSALGQRGGADAALRTSVVVASGLPIFWVALVLQLLLATTLRVFPIAGTFSPHVAVPAVTGMSMVDAAVAGRPDLVGDALYHLILPAAILALPFTAQLFRALRTEMIGVLDSEFVDAARATGASTRRLVFRHLLPNAAGPAITIVGATVSMMIGSAVLVESVFGFSGIGAYLASAVANSDRFAVIGGVLVIGAVIVAISFAVDLIQMLRDPRHRTQQGLA